jgi:hypothetical protein
MDQVAVQAHRSELSRLGDALVGDDLGVTGEAGHVHGFICTGQPRKHERKIFSPIVLEIKFNFESRSFSHL